MAAALAWLAESAARAQKGRVGLVIRMQAESVHRRCRATALLDLRERLMPLARAHPAGSMLLHGDSHTYHDDEPLPGVRRLESGVHPS